NLKMIVDSFENLKNLKDFRFEVRHSAFNESLDNHLTVLKSIENLPLIERLSLNIGDSNFSDHDSAMRLFGEFCRNFKLKQFSLDMRRFGSEKMQSVFLKFLDTLSKSLSTQVK